MQEIGVKFADRLNNINVDVFSRSKAAVGLLTIVIPTVASAASRILFFLSLFALASPMVSGNALAEPKHPSHRRPSPALLLSKTVNELQIQLHQTRSLEATNTASLLANITRLQDQVVHESVLESDDARQLKRLLADDEGRIAAHETRFSDLSALGGIDASRFGVIATLLGSLMTVIVIFFTLRTSEAAVAVAKNQIFEETKDLKADFEAQIKDAMSRFSDMAKEAVMHLSTTEKAAEAAQQTIERFNKFVTGVTGVLISAKESEIDEPGSPAQDQAQQEALASQLRDATAHAPEPRSFENLFARGALLLKEGKFDSALEFFDEAEIIAPDLENRVSVLNSKALALRFLGRSDEALHEFDKVIDAVASNQTQALSQKLDSELADALVRKAIVQGGLDRLSESIDTFSKLLRRFPLTSKDRSIRYALVRGLRSLGVAYLKLQHHDQARTSFQRAIQAFESSTEPEIRKEVESAREYLMDL